MIALAQFSAPTSLTGRASAGSRGGRNAAPRGSILLVDDEPNSLSAHKRLLERNYQVTAASSAREALSYIDEKAYYDVFLCDLAMPIMSGMEFSRELERTRPDYVERVVFLTGGAYTPKAITFLNR